ncbi:hypothetical protein [Streptomyces sp. Da 82-17]|uniref:hypothetical protein n=1 Tax=Streptomyces sp. Da 82-17 TaxID=3377116 RepID=UPI0038D50DD9
MSGVVTLLLLVASLSSWAALRAAREMRRLRAETANYPQPNAGFTPGTNSTDANSTHPYPRWEN